MPPVGNDVELTIGCFQPYSIYPKLSSSALLYDVLDSRLIETIDLRCSPFGCVKPLRRSTRKLPALPRTHLRPRTELGSRPLALSVVDQDYAELELGL